MLVATTRSADTARVKDMPLRADPSGREALAFVAMLVLGFFATQLDWAQVGATCANTAVTRGFGESTNPISWAFVYLLALLAVAVALFLPPRIATALDGLALLVGIAAVALAIGEALAPFEALRPGPPAARVSCGMDLALGAWLALASLAAIASVLVIRLRR